MIKSFENFLNESYYEDLTLNEKFGINKTVSDLSDLAFVEIKKNPEKKKHIITDGTYTIVININDIIGGSNFSSLPSTGEKNRLFIEVGAYGDSDVKLHTILIHEINHAIEWANMNKKSKDLFNFKTLNDPYKKIKIDDANQANSPFHYLVYILGDHEMKSRIHELYLSLKKEIGDKKLSNDELKKIFNEKLNIFRPVNHNFIRVQIDKLFRLLPDDLDENTIITNKDSAREYKIGKEISEFLQKKKINKNDLKQLRKFFDVQLSKLERSTNKLLSHFI